MNSIFFYKFSWRLNGMRPYNSYVFKLHSKILLFCSVALKRHVPEFQKFLSYSVFTPQKERIPKISMAQLFELGFDESDVLTKIHLQQQQMIGIRLIVFG